MTGALWYAAADLIPRREERKVILMLTDGGPDDWASAAEMIAKATAAGIEMIGIGIVRMSADCSQSPSGSALLPTSRRSCSGSLSGSC